MDRLQCQHITTFDGDEKEIFYDLIFILSIHWVERQVYHLLITDGKPVSLLLRLIYVS